VTDIKLGVPLSVNIDNGIAAMAIAWLCGVTEEELREGMASFRGVERRFDFKLKTDAKVYLSDYAHHPAEIRQSAQSIRELYAGRKVTAIFQPHLYSRTQDFYSEFAESLSLFDEVILTDIYPAREEPIPGVSSKLIYDHLKPSVQKLMIGKSEVVATVEAKKNDIEVLVTLGAGDIENYAAEITQILKS
jgi:UDP-N-acetylmuramate--alanine ligase